MTKKKQAKPKRAVKRTNRPKQQRQQQENVLIPAGVNNRATMPRGTQSHHLGPCEEVVAVITAPAEAVAGTVVFNEIISHKSVKRLGLMSDLFQRICWSLMQLHLVALNGSLVTSGYVMGFVEDPELEIPTNPSDVIAFLTALRTTTVRQNWVESSAGTLVSLKDLPEMFTQRGSDVRRFSPGRLVIALAGNPGPNTTFQLNLKYIVGLSVPCAIAPTPPPPPRTFTLTADLQPGWSSPEAGARANVAGGALPPIGEWVPPPNIHTILYEPGAILVFDGSDAPETFPERMVSAVLTRLRVTATVGTWLTSVTPTWYLSNGTSFEGWPLTAFTIAGETVTMPATTTGFWASRGDFGIVSGPVMSAQVPSALMESGAILTAG